MKQNSFGRRKLASLVIGSSPLYLTVAGALAQTNAGPVPPPQVNNFTATNSMNGATSNQSGTSQASDTTGNEPGSDLVSVEYRNAPLVEVIRTLADGANINITLSPEVEKGSPVSIRLNKVTYEQAMKSILEAYKFGSVFENGILKIDTLANLNAVREEKLKEKESAWKILPTKRLVWQVNYAKATELQPLLDVMLKGYKVDPRFSIISDKRTNKLVIEGIADALVEAKSILENLDKRKQQVLIEARIVEASNELSKTLSITWGTRFGFDGNRGLANGLIFPNSLTGNVGGAGALGSSAPNPGLATSPTQFGTLQFTVGSINNLINIDAILRAYETESLANVIASPRVVVQDQEKAIIKEDVQLSRNVLGPDGKPEGRNTIAALELQVAPQVTSENTLELDIQVQRQTPTNPPTDPVQGSIKRQANTKLIVGNGETAVIGGLYQTQKFKGQGRVPFLGKLPLIGALFRSNEEQSFRSELMVLITPRILPGGPGRSSARTDLPILGGDSGTVSNNGGDFGNAGGNSFGNNSGNVNSNSNSQNAKKNNAAGGSAPVSKSNAAGAAAPSGNDFGSPDDFGSDIPPGNGAGLGGGSTNTAKANAGGGGNNLDNLGNGGGGDSGGENGGGNNLNNLGNGGGNSGGGSGDEGNLNNLNGGNGGGGAPANQSGSGGGNNLNNLNGGDL
ncbi:MAG: secretin N-terminal domain-containing protein [Silvanigrellaceae bacterium]